MAKVIGLTGGIATGKSTVSSMFAEQGIPVIDADQLAREVVQPGEPAYEQIIAAFGEKILQEDGTLNRKHLGEIVFSDEAKRKQLNGIVHPAIRERMIEQRDAFIKSGESLVVLDIPLLFESKLEHFADLTVVVYVDEQIQLERLMKRNDFTKKEALQRMEAQMPIKEKARLADVVIDNNGTIEQTKKQLEELLYAWQEN